MNLKKISKFLVIILLAFGTLSACSDISEPTKENTDPVSDLDNENNREGLADYSVCENNDVLFLERENGANGKFNLAGKIISFDGPEPWADDSTVTFIAMEVTSGTKEAIDYFIELAKAGNTINSLKLDKLRFRLGLLENENISTTANISSFTRQKILEVMNTEEEITLNMMMPLREGAGVGGDFSFACQIDRDN